MEKTAKKILLCFVAATVVGSLLHLLYAMLPNAVVAVFSPMNDSPWEQLKTVFWPMLAAAFLLTRQGGKCARGPWFAALLLQSVLLLGLGCFYRMVLRGESTLVSVLIFVAVMAFGFWFSQRVQAEKITSGTRDSLAFAVFAVLVLVVLFSFLPPEGRMFADSSVVNTFATIPY